MSGEINFFTQGGNCTGHWEIHTLHAVVLLMLQKCSEYISFSLNSKLIFSEFPESMASHTAWLQHSFVWARAEVFSMGTDTGGEGWRRGQDPGVLWVGGQVEVTRWDAAWPSGEVTSADSSPFLTLCGGQGTIPPTPKRSFWDKTKQDSIIVQWKEETVSVFIFKHQLLVIVGPHWFLPCMLQTPVDCDIVKVSLTLCGCQKIWHAEGLF